MTTRPNASRATQAGLRQTYGELEANPIRLSQETVKRVVDLLNQHLSTEYVLYHQYKKHHWLVLGAQFRDLHLLLDEHADGVREIADRIAERITYMGGVPIGRPSKLEEFAYIQHEDEGRFGVRQMLERDLAANQIILGKLRDHVRIVNEAGDYGTEHLLKKWVVKHEKWAHELDAFLQRETLCEFPTTH